MQSHMTYKALRCRSCQCTVTVTTIPNLHLLQTNKYSRSSVEWRSLKLRDWKLQFYHDVLILLLQLAISIHLFADQLAFGVRKGMWNWFLMVVKLQLSTHSVARHGRQWDLFHRHSFLPTLHSEFILTADSATPSFYRQLSERIMSFSPGQGNSTDYSGYHLDGDPTSEGIERVFIVRTTLDSRTCSTALLCSRMKNFLRFTAKRR